MSGFFVRKAITLLLAHALLLPIAYGQQQTTESTRPRRAEQVWAPPSVTNPIDPIPPLAIATAPEPKIRVALTTDARSAVISTTGHLMNAIGIRPTLRAPLSPRVPVFP